MKKRLARRGGPRKRNKLTKGLKRGIRIGEFKRLFAYRQVAGKGYVPSPCDADSIRELVAELAHLSPRELGEAFQVTAEDYCGGGPFRQIAPIDMTKEDRKKCSYVRRQQRRQEKRWARGQRRQSDSAAQQKPWLNLGMSKATYYRKIKAGQMTNRRETDLARINLRVSARVVSTTMARENEEKQDRVSLSWSSTTASELRVLAKRAAMEKCPDPGMKPGGIRERAWLSVMAKHAAAQTDAA